jgi:hypothetical protein
LSFESIVEITTELDRPCDVLVEMSTDCEVLLLDWRAVAVERSTDCDVTPEPLPEMSVDCDTFSEAAADALVVAVEMSTDWDVFLLDSPAVRDESSTD